MTTMMRREKEEKEDSNNYDDNLGIIIDSDVTAQHFRRHRDSNPGPLATAEWRWPLGHSLPSNGMAAADLVNSLQSSIANGLYVPVSCAVTALLIPCNQRTVHGPGLGVLFGRLIICGSTHLCADLFIYFQNSGCNSANSKIAEYTIQYMHTWY